MAIDVSTEVAIRRARQEVAAYAMDPENDPAWISGIVEAKMLTEPPFGVGTRVGRLAKFMGRRIEYVLEVVEHVPESLLDMRSVKGPFPMRVTYGFDEADGGTRARIRVRGEASGFFKLASPLLARAVRRNVGKDRGNLKKLLESSATSEVS